MVFTPPVFLFLYLPIFFSIYFFLKDRYRNYFLILFSLIFYFWAEPKFILVVLSTIVTDWLLGNRIYGSQGLKTKQFYLTLFISSNVLLLFYFKYMNFFVGNLNDFLKWMGFAPTSWTSVALPLGLSFIVFEKITYGVGLYKGIGKPAKSITQYILFVLLFPKLIAGPIIKYYEIAEQLENRKITLPDLGYGIFRFSLGLAKKVWIADTLAIIADKTFQLPVPTLNVQQAWIGIICFQGKKTFP
jgi:alginate O-acetyltransferase complex protein AlgI